MKEITYAQAIKEAIAEEMEHDPTVFMMGEDIGLYGGAFGVTKGLSEQFGDRIKNTPMSEAAITGIATGSALAGLKPIVEIMFMDFLTLTLDQLFNHATQYRYISNGQLKVPLVIRTAAGGGRGYGATHSKSLEPFLLGIPGLKIICPSNPEDAKGLLKSAIRDNNPVVFIENKLLYGKKGLVPEEEYLTPLGKAKIVQEGTDATIITYSRMVQESILATQESPLSTEIIDLRTLTPLDIETITKSVKKTGKVIIVEESFLTGGVGAEISAQIIEHCFDYLDAPIQRVAAKDVHIPCSPVLEQEVLPDKTNILQALNKFK